MSKLVLRRALRLGAAWLPLVALIVACGAGGSSSEGTDEADPDAQLIADVRSRFDCTSQRFYCDALDRFAAGQAPAPTTQAYALIGRTYRATAGEEVDWFVARPGEAMANGEILAENAEETQQLAEVLRMLQAGQTVPATHPVMAYVQSLATGGSLPHPTELRGRSRYYRNADGRDVYIRQNGQEIIVVERLDPDASVGVFRRP